MQEITPGHINVFRSLGHRVIGTGNHFVFLAPSSRATIYLFKTLEVKQEWTLAKLKANPKMRMDGDYLLTTTDENPCVNLTEREFAVLYAAGVEYRRRETPHT